MTVIANLRVVRADNGEQFVTGCYAGNPCGCQIKGAGICNDPLRIEYCPQHKASTQLPQVLRKVEWHRDECPFCFADSVDGHTVGCKLAAAIAAAGA